MTSRGWKKDYDVGDDGDDGCGESDMDDENNNNNKNKKTTTIMIEKE